MNMPYQQPMMNYTPNYGAYQYNPMANYQRYQQPEPTQGISGRVVQAVETINPNEVPMDGSVAFFPKQDLTEIYAKSWNADGTIRTLTFKPVLNGKTDILSGDTEKLEFDLSEKATEGIMAKLNELSEKMYYSEPIAPHVSESNYDRAKRHYTETKEMHKGASTEDKEHKMKALDMYIRELSGDISELLNDMTPDERNLLRTKMSNLASKL